MGFPAIATPVKQCEWCGTSFERKRTGKRHQLECASNFMRRRFCSISCAAAKQHATEPPTAAASRKRAQKSVSGFCEACGTSADLTIHHVNGDPMDNSPSNMQTLCRQCHAFWHGLLKRIGRKPETPMPRLIEFKNCAPSATPSSRKLGPRSSAP